MNPAFLDVLAFHAKFCPSQIGEAPAEPSSKISNLRSALMREELDETIHAMSQGDIPGVADGLVDLIYVAIGTAIAYGIDLRPVWDAVQAANMAKVGGPTRADGKVLKPEGWQPPDIEGVLARQRPLGEMLPEGSPS